MAESDLVRKMNTIDVKELLKVEGKDEATPDNTSKLVRRAKGTTRCRQQLPANDSF